MKLLVRSASVLALAGSFFVPVAASALSFSLGANSNGGFFFGIGSGSGMGGFYCGASSICGLASTFLYIINNVLVPLLFAIAFLVFLYGVFKSYIWSGGDTEAIDSGHRLILWGLVGFVVMISLWGLVNVVANTFGLAGYGAPRLPTSTSSQYPGFPGGGFGF